MSQLTLQDLIEEADLGYLQMPPECTGCDYRGFDLKSRLVQSVHNMPGEFIYCLYCKDCNEILKSGTADVIPAEHIRWFDLWSSCLRVACKLPNMSPHRKVWCDMASAAGHLGRETL